MKIRLKWVLTSLAAILVGATVTVYAVLSSFDFDDLRGVIEDQAKAATGRSLTIAGRMDLQISLTPKITIEKITFGNAPWGTWPELFSLRRLEVEVALLPLLSGTIEVHRLVAIEPVILLETNAHGRGNWMIEAFGEAESSAAVDLGSIPAFRRIGIRDGRAIYRDGPKGQEFLVKLDNLDAWAETPASPSTVDLQGSYNGMSFGAGGTLGSRDELLGGGRFPVDLKIVAADTSLSVRGSVGNLATWQGLDLRVQLTGTNISDLAPLFGEDAPPLGPYDLAGRLGDTKDGVRIDQVSLVLGNSRLSGEAAISLAGDRPKITAKLKADALDIKDFSGPADAELEPEAGRIFSDDPLPFAALQVFDALVELSAEQARFDDKTMASDLSLVLELADGRLDLRDIEAGFSGGALSGQMTIDTGGADPQFVLDLRAENFDYGHFLQGRDVTDGVDGQLDVQADLSATGKTLHAWAKNLNGRVDMTGGEGHVRSDLLSASGTGLIDMFSTWREGEDDLKLNCVVMRLPVEGGVVKPEAILIDTDAVTVGVTGVIDLGEESLNLRVTPQAKHAGLMSLAVPLRVSGPILEPSTGPDPIGTVLGAAKIAGMFINPLVAGAVIILESELSAKNPCVAAIDSGTPSQGEGAAEEAETTPRGNLHD